MSVGRIIGRGLTLRCPNCGAHSLFAGLLKASERCSGCGLLFEREEGFFLGAMVFNYALTVLLAVVLPAVLLLANLAPIWVIIGIAVGTSIILPFLFYRPSKSLWLMTYYAFVPGDLPANEPANTDTREHRI